MLKRLLPFLPVLIIIACAPDLSDPRIQSAVIKSLTATLWTPVPPSATPTVEPNTARIVEALNTVMVGTDPLSETVDAKFSVIDVQVIADQTTSVSTTLRIHVDCEWVFSDSCTPETAFVMLMRAFSANDKVLQHVLNQTPVTIQNLEMLAFDRMQPSGMIIIAWSDVIDFAIGKINGNQIGSRITRLASAP
jgi:hypothetical protein